MDKALQMAVVAMGTAHPSPNDAHPNEEVGAESETKMKWLHEFITLSLPGSRHQVHDNNKVP